VLVDVDRVIAGGRILTMDDRDTVIQDGAVAVHGTDIVAVGERKDVESRFRGREVIDADRCLVMPGLINCHTHAAMTCFRGIADDLSLMDWLNNYIFPAEAKNVDGELAYWGSMLACAEMIKSGPTTFCDMYIFEDETAMAAHKAGMRCLLGEVLFDFPSPNFKTPKEGLQYTRNLLEKWADDPLVNIFVEPHALYTCSPELLKESKSLADRYGVPLGMHFVETRSELEGLKDKFGKKPVRLLDELGVLDDRFIAFHGVWMDDEDMSAFAEKGCKVVHNPESNMKLASGVAPVPEMLSAGVTVGLGTDGCASNNNLDMFQEMDMAAKLHKVHRLDPTVMNAKTVVDLATRMGARVLGMEKLVGILRPGMKADIVILDLNRPHLTPIYHEYSHVVYSATGSDVETVLINGNVVMRHGKLLTIDEEEVMARVREIARRIKKSLNLP
jgi:5-methylthioadenosine/S-adenosylhomocysteine deaminase